MRCWADMGYGAPLWTVHWLHTQCGKYMLQHIAGARMCEIGENNATPTCDT